MKTVVKTVRFIHEKGIAHRDIKADNILIAKNGSGRLKLIDFAFSHEMKDGKLVENYCGTPSYMSPEIFLKEPHCPQKADIWALGVLAFRLFSGQMPFVGRINSHLANRKEMIEYEVLNTPVPIELIKRSSKKFQNWVLSCLQMDPAKRPTSTELHRDPWIREYPC